MLKLKDVFSAQKAVPYVLRLLFAWLVSKVIICLKNSAILRVLYDFMQINMLEHANAATMTAITVIAKVIVFCVAVLLTLD